MPKNESAASAFITRLNMNGLRGRVLHMPAPKTVPGGHPKDILFIYGHHSSLERWFGLMQNLNRYGAVTMPDLPGFGGMDSFYKIGRSGSIDNLADYLASFIKLRYKRKKVTVAGMSLGFVIVTRMLQRYPELTNRVNMLVSIAGFAHKSDFTFGKRRMFAYKLGATVFSLPVFSHFFRYVCLHPWILRSVYRHTHNAKDKFKGVSEEELQEIMDVEIGLWHNNEVRTYMRTTKEFLSLNNCDRAVNLPVYHVGIKGDRYFDGVSVEQHYREIFTDYHLLAELSVGNHAPSIIADAKAAAPFVPLKLRRLLSK